MDRLTATYVFVTIAQRGSLTAAAEALDMSRAMVSRYLAEMEGWMGARLFHRNTRRIGLTPAGERVLAQSEALLALSQQMRQGLGDPAAELRGVLRVTCAQSLAQARVAAMVGRFLARHPQAAIELVVMEKTVNLVEERIDLSIRITNTLDPGLIARPLGQCRSVVCAAPDYLARRGRPASVADLAGHNCLGYTYFGRSPWEFSGPGGEPLSVAARGNLSANDSMTLLSATLDGAGISLQPRYAVGPYLDSGALVELLPGLEPRPLGIHAVYTSKSRQSLLMRAFLDDLVRAFEASELAPPAAG